MTTLQVELSNQPASKQWGQQALLSFQEQSFEEQSAIIHIDVEEPIRSIQKVARKLDDLGIPHVTLAGEWSFNQQWAFALSFTKAKNPGAIVWAKTDDREALDKAFSALLIARKWVNDTPENLSPESLANRAGEWIAGLSPNYVSVSQIVGEELRDQGWVGIYEVGKGSRRPPVMLTIDFNPTGNSDTPIDTVLVGKGITFDSGGYSIKTSEGMLTMKADMAGAATVTGALGLAILNGLNKRVKLILCCAENLISGHAYKLGDILQYKNGVTVEVVNTDAEGRLVLADGLIAATETKAKRVIDAATLTGAAVNALGHDYHAIFSRDEALTQRLIEKARIKGEKFWPLPLEDWHSEQCPSYFADTANSRPVKGGGAGGASNAAGFLARFAPKSGWLHLDLAAAYHGTATSLMPAGATGIGILSLAELLLD